MKHLAHEGEEEVIEIKISETEHPKTFKALVESMVENTGCTEEEAKNYYRTTPIPLELYVNKDFNSLWGLDSNDVGGQDWIIDPYDGHTLEYIPEND